MPATGGGKPGTMPGATMITSVRVPLRLRQVICATPASRINAVSCECFSSIMIARFSTELVVSALESLSSWRAVSHEIFLRPRSLRAPDARAGLILAMYQRHCCANGITHAHNVHSTYLVICVANDSH